ncbi:LysR family transcriptional regulator [Pseudomonas typographi]|uniref:LysR family transcriptional regulator n=1 Tax=Pseudomonas typographi TaxID=2715964 RepID=A0ABR7YX83_9PSED|nr:LysR family transcriptional regulator [Pseudomonas typographi]MBD1551186.1 LysR family transcriptional regulator [Pseudomonas typographi]MBD1597792.1 LysR family transcriptional regulator [Pseudomonas typographi]
MVNPQWLTSFATVAELGNFTRSAERLGLTQAAVSQHIKHLEAQFGPLLVRRPRHVEMTPAGLALLDYAAEVDRAARAFQARLCGADEQQGDISLVSPGSIGLALYPLLLHYQQRHPGLVIRHRFAPDGEVLNAVLSNHFELGLLTFKPDDARIAARHFGEEPLELVLPAGVRYEGWETLQRLGFIDHPDGQAMAMRLFSRRYPGQPGLRALPVRGFTNQVGLILEPVARGLGFTVLPRFARQAFAQQGALQLVECGNPVVDTLWLIHRAEWPLAARAQRAVADLQAQLAAKGSADRSLARQPVERGLGEQ